MALKQSEKRTLEFTRKNAKAGKPFFVLYWPNFLNFLKPDLPKKTYSGGKVAESFVAVDAFVVQVMDELKELGIAENTLFIAMADNGPMVPSPPPGWGMIPIIYREGKGDFTEGGVRVPVISLLVTLSAIYLIIGQPLNPCDIQIISPLQISIPPLAYQIENRF